MYFLPVSLWGGCMLDASLYVIIQTNGGFTLLKHLVVEDCGNFSSIRILILLIHQL